MKINHEIPPHTDSNIKCTINFYIKTEPCITEFYDIISDAPKTLQIANQTDGHIYDISDLMLIGAFAAQQGEVWLLDTTIPHSVVPVNELSDRVALCIATRFHDFNAVRDMLKETGAL
jgi:hypothetical protein